MDEGRGDVGLIDVLDQAGEDGPCLHVRAAADLAGSPRPRQGSAGLYRQKPARNSPSGGSPDSPGVGGSRLLQGELHERRRIEVRDQRGPLPSMTSSLIEPFTLINRSGSQASGRFAGVIAPEATSRS